MAEPDDDVLRKADALLSRHRAAPGGEALPDPPADFPVLTEIIEESETPSDPRAPVREPTLSEAALAQLEQDLRLQLLQLLGPEFERMIESKVHDRLGAKVDEVMTLARTVLEAEVRAVVREALAEVIAAETDRLKSARKRD